MFLCQYQTVMGSILCIEELPFRGQVHHWIVNNPFANILINKTVAGFADNLQMQVPGGSLQGTKATFQQLALICLFMLFSMLFGISDTD